MGLVIYTTFFLRGVPRSAGLSFLCSLLILNAANGFWPYGSQRVITKPGSSSLASFRNQFRSEKNKLSERQVAAKSFEKKQKLALKISLDVARVGGLFMVCVISFWGYLAASKELDLAFTAHLGIQRSATDAFSPFITLLSLIYSIILAQIYDYEFARQGAIQDGLFTEAGALAVLDGIVETLSRRDPAVQKERPRLLGIVRDCASDLLHSGFTAQNSSQTSLFNPADRQLLALVDDLEFNAGERSASLCRAAGDTVIGLGRARAQRISAVAAALPLVQRLAERAIAGVVLLSFVLVDLGAPKLEATLFSIVCGSFFLINSFLQDLSDPFGGSWSVAESSKRDLEWLVTDINSRLRFYAASPPSP